MKPSDNTANTTLRLIDVQKKGSACWSSFCTLYEEAFPAIERKPMEMMKRLTEQGKMELLAIVDSESGSDRFVGLAINMMDGDTALLDYFAIAPACRNGGFGSRSLALLLERFRGKKYIFEIEMQDSSAENADERKRRKAFYLRNGLKETGLFANVYGTDFEMLTPDGSLSFQQYTDFLQTILGGLGIELLKPILISQRDDSGASRPVFHGSDIERVCSIYHLNRNDIVNFGANVNPLGISAEVKKCLADRLDLLSVYPDRQYTGLRQVISKYCGVPADFVLPGNGSSELISLLIEAKAPENTLILGPTYSEYSRELAFSGSTQTYFHLREEDDFAVNIPELCRTLEKGYDFLILCNPNNPTSSAIFREDLRRLLAFCSKHDIFVMIDETYVEFAPDIATVTAVPLTAEFDNLMVLRGVSKFFAAPGMRLGYGITGNRKFLQKMRKKQTPWSLNSLGAYAGEQMLKDSSYIQKTRDLILTERIRIAKELDSIPAYKAYPAYANFFLIRILRPGLTSAHVFEACIRRGLMIRDCSSFQCLEGEFVRFCIMKPEDNTRLLKVLRTL